MARFERFWSKVDTDGPIAPGMADACWVWTACKNGDGYGSFWLIDGMRGAHRVAYEMTHGPIPCGMTIDHLCMNRACVNPGHLEPVPLPVNVMRGNGTGARNARKTHCPSGHAYTHQNTYIDSAGGRKCKACTHRRNRARASK